MRLPSRPVRLLAVAGLAAAVVSSAPASGAADTSQVPTPGISCDKGSLPEKTQGRAPLSDVASGRYAKGYRCNAVQVSHVGTRGGYRVERYVDKAGHECGFYDTTLLFPKDAAEGAGTVVLDMSNPAKPVQTDVIRSFAFASPHESVRLNQKRGIIAAVAANPADHPGFVDLWDVSADCRHPQLLSSSPMGVLGHEGGFSPDGNTYYVASLYGHTLAALDVSNPRVPVVAWFSLAYSPHGVSVSEDGKTLYVAEAAFDDSNDPRGTFSGLTVLDVSQVQARVLNPTVPIVSRLTWKTVSTPQNATPFTSKGHRYVLETDEFGSGASIGAARIIDVQDIRKPFVVSELRLAVNAAKAQGEDLEADPGNSQMFQGYQGHYCSLPSRIDPQTIACSFIMSGLRVFDISTPAKPREIAYFNKPAASSVPAGVPQQAGIIGSFAMSAPAYDGKTGDIWYSDGNSGFYVVRLTGAARRPFARTVHLPGN